MAITIELTARIVPLDNESEPAWHLAMEELANLLIADAPSVSTATEVSIEEKAHA